MAIEPAEDFLAAITIDPEFEKHLAEKMRANLVQAGVRRVEVIQAIALKAGCTRDIAALALISLGVDAIGPDMAEALEHYLED